MLLLVPVSAQSVYAVTDRNVCRVEQLQSFREGGVMSWPCTNLCSFAPFPVPCYIFRMKRVLHILSMETVQSPATFSV